MMMTTTTWTRDKVEELAKGSGLGRVSVDDIHAICKLLNCREGGSKKVLVQRIHATLHLPYDEAAYDVVGWVMPQYRKRAVPTPLVPMKRVQWEGSVQEQLEQARVARANVLVEIKALLMPIRQAARAAMEEETFSPTNVTTLMKCCETSLARHEELKKDMEAIDRATHLLLARYANTILTCPVCLDETATLFRVMHPCGHVVCDICCQKIERKCPICRDAYLISSTIKPS